MEEQYWNHVQYYPNHIKLSPSVEFEMKALLTHFAAGELCRRSIVLPVSQLLNHVYLKIHILRMIRRHHIPLNRAIVLYNCSEHYQVSCFSKGSKNCLTGAITANAETNTYKNWILGEPFHYLTSSVR